MEKMIESFIEKELKHHKNLSKKVEEIIDEYVDVIERMIPNEFKNAFGVGSAGSHSQFGIHYGFYNDELECYSVPGGDYYIANDFNAHVNGATFDQQLDFVKSIPEWLERGKEAMSTVNNGAIAAIEKIKAIAEK